MEIPPGPGGNYRLAQLDDYAALPRRGLPWVPPLTLVLRARVARVDLPGTWGFGLWNDQFGFSLGFGGTSGRLPALPNTAWFFHASLPNSLAFRDDLPAHGFFAGTMRSPALPAPLLAPALLALPLLAVRPLSRLARRLAARVVHQAGEPVEVDVTSWHDYEMEWTATACNLAVDGMPVLQTTVTPRCPLGLVVWIDNQYAAWGPDGRLGWGTLANGPAWLEVEGLEISA